MQTQLESARPKQGVEARYSAIGQTDKLLNNMYKMSCECHPSCVSGGVKDSACICRLYGPIAASQTCPSFPVRVDANAEDSGSVRVLHPACDL